MNTRGSTKKEFWIIVRSTFVLLLLGLLRDTVLGVFN